MQEAMRHSGLAWRMLESACLNAALVQPGGIVRVGEQMPVDVEGDRDAAVPRCEKWTEPAPPVGLRRCRAAADARPVELLVV